METDRSVDMPCLLVVAGSPSLQKGMIDVLASMYRVHLAAGSYEALEAAHAETAPDLIVVDIDLPGDSSLELCRQLKADAVTREIPIILLRDIDKIHDEPRWLELGLSEFIAKPIDASLLLARVAHECRVNSAVVFVRSKRAFIDRELERRSREVSVLKQVTILALASLAETRDLETENHARRTQHYVRVLADHLANDARYATALDPERRKLIVDAVPLHDIGKIGIPDRILLKAGPLTAEEFEIMKTHTTLGHDAIQRAEDQLGLKVSFLWAVKELTYSHHERWDGHGYPQGLAGQDIPLSARLMALADVYDALITRRVYKAAMSHLEAVAYIVGKREVDFDPDIVDAFVSNQQRFREISERFAEGATRAV